MRPHTEVSPAPNLHHNCCTPLSVSTLLLDNKYNVLLVVDVATEVSECEEPWFSAFKYFTCSFQRFQNICTSNNCYNQQISVVEIINTTLLFWKPPSSKYNTRLVQKWALSDLCFLLWKTLKATHSSGYTAINSKVSTSGSTPGRYVKEASFAGRSLSVARISLVGVTPWRGGEFLWFVRWVFVYLSVLDESLFLLLWSGRKGSLLIPCPRNRSIRRTATSGCD